MSLAIVGVCTSFALLMFLVLLSARDITLSFSSYLTSQHYRGFLLVLMLFWFDGVSYVFIICSYVLGDCSGWIPMRFSEMDHLSYGHSFILFLEAMKISSIFD